MICPSVPDAQMVPVAILGSYPLLSILGRESNPIVTTVAPTIPVLAANNIPTTVTEMPSPPLNCPNSLLRSSSNSSAIFAFSSVIPIKTKRGTAMSVSLFMIPKSRLGTVPRNAISNTPNSEPIKAKKSATPPKLNATG